MFKHHDPVQKVFDWLCQRNNICASSKSIAASSLQKHVFDARKLYKQPLGYKIPYDNAQFRAAYLIAYFPYYIEPICAALECANLSDSLFHKGTLNVAFFGGGPCPEALGLAAYLRNRAPKLLRVETIAFDCQPGWQAAQLSLIPSMLPEYCSPETSFNLSSKQCDVAECLVRQCACGIANTDIIIAQNFLTEVYTNRASAIATFERLIRRSTCRYLVFVENNYAEVKDLMNELSAHLFEKGLTTSKPVAETTTIRPNFRLPQVLQQHLFTCEDGLKPKSKVTFHHIVLEIAR
jgi:hypothetical protein